MVSGVSGILVFSRSLFSSLFPKGLLEHFSQVYANSCLMTVEDLIHLRFIIKCLLSSHPLLPF